MENEILWREYKTHPTTNLKKQITLRYQNLVHYVIQNSRFQKFDVVDERDFFQFGVEGLSEAIDRFDPDYGTKFETYAIQRIRGKIIDELRKIQIKPRATSPNDVRYTTLSLTESYDDEGGYMLYETIPSDAEKPDSIYEDSEEKAILVNAIKSLNERDRTIISLYYYENLDYKEIASLMNITISRVSQIHSRIINELKKKIQLKYDRVAVA
jgi:RNA polymerase sigma factor for flagellar operon FliA